MNLMAACKHGFFPLAFRSRFAESKADVTRGASIYRFSQSALIKYRRILPGQRIPRYSPSFYSRNSVQENSLYPSSNLTNITNYLPGLVKKLRKYSGRELKVERYTL